MRFCSPYGPGAAALCAALFVAGCNRPVGSVTGKVTYQGKELKGGGVTFVSTEGQQSFAATITPEGTYKVPDLLGGDYKVCVDTSSLKPAKGGLSVPGAAAYQQPVVPKGAKTGPPPGAVLPEGYQASDPAAMAKNNSAKRYVAIPPKYAEAGTTDLTYTFKGGAETFDIDLK
ncbi:hypothetical protein J0H58_36700 [bacterium]|nr:hypothetical protein [bacterium]